MRKKDTLILTYAERPWATRRLSQFLGTFQLDRLTGIYLRQGVCEFDRARILQGFALSPWQLQAVASAWNLTIDASYSDRTANGHASTFYADFTQRRRECISPHVQMSQVSLSDELRVPHVTHELSHLFYRSMQEEMRIAYRKYLQSTVDARSADVTQYAWGYFAEWLASMNEPTSVPHVLAKQRRLWNAFAEEAFCETIAALHCPAYVPAQWISTIDIADRGAAIERITGLAVGWRQQVLIAH
jgi:hypothetical protein